MANPLSYLVCLLQAIWARCLTAFSRPTRHGDDSSARVVLPTFIPMTTSNNRATTSSGRAGDLESQPSEGSWQTEKAQFMRSPSLMRSGSTFPLTDKDTKTKTRQATKACAATLQSAPNPQVGVLDWKSLNYKISVPSAPDSSACPPFHRPFLPRSAPPVLSPPAPLASTILPPSVDLSPPPTSIPGIAIVETDDNHTTKHLATDSPIDLTDCTRISDQRALSALLTQSVFAPTTYAPNTRSAATGLLSDMSSVRVLRSIPLPQNCDSKQLADPLAENCKVYFDGVPYPDLFDFAMYSKRASDRISMLRRVSNSPAGLLELAHKDVSWDTACYGLSGTRSFTFGAASLQVPDACPGLDLSTPPLRIVKRGRERSVSTHDVLRRCQPSSAFSDRIRTSTN